MSVLSFFRLKERLFYGWVLVAAFFIISTTTWGIRLSFGVFFKALESEFDLTRAATSAIFSTSMILSGIFAILGGWAIDKYGPRIVLFLIGLSIGLSLLLTSQVNSFWQLFITYSLLLSPSGSAVYVGIMSTVSRWFDRRRGLALGIATSGIGFGMAVTAPFAAFLISVFDWRMAYIVMGLIAWFVMIPISRLLKKEPHQINTHYNRIDLYSSDNINHEYNITSQDLSLSQVFRTKTFWLIALIRFLFAVCIFLIITHLVPRITDIGITANDAARVLSLVGGAAIVGRIIMGAVSDAIGRKLAAVICALLQATALLWIIWAESIWMFSLFALFFGFAWGGLGPIMSALAGESFGLSKIGAIMGVLEVGFGAGAAIGPAFGGLIFDITKNYSIAFFIAALAMLVVTLLIFPIKQETNRLPHLGKSS